MWVAIVQFFISLPETGILDMSTVYILDQLSIHDETKANITAAIFIVSCSVGLIIGPLFVLPTLQRWKWRYFSIDIYPKNVYQPITCVFDVLCYQ